MFLSSQTSSIVKQSPLAHISPQYSILHLNPALTTKLETKMSEKKPEGKVSSVSLEESLRGCYSCRGMEGALHSSDTKSTLRADHDMSLGR